MLDRLVAMEHEALDTAVAALMDNKVTGIDAYPYLFHSQPGTPYIVHRVGPSAPSNLMEDASIRDYDVFIRVVVGHLTANYKGENEELLDEILPLLEDYLLKHPMLTTDSGAFTAEPTWLFPEGIELGDTSGVIPFEIGGIGSTHIGEELSFTMTVIRTLEQS
jgi:hypothetical protein